MKIQFKLNDRLTTADVVPGLTLLEYLRGEELYAVKHGCDHGECGACTVLINDMAVNACLTLMFSVEGKRVETLENFSSHIQLHPLQESFLDTGAVQCGFCTPGMVMSMEALDREGKKITEDDVRDSMTGNLCRCTGYVKPVKAALNALLEKKNRKREL